jgi:hypothetical protein
MHFHTERTTTDKLGETLDELAGPDALRVTPTFTGGRDWVVVAEHREHERTGPPMEWAAWELTLRDLADAADAAIEGRGDSDSLRAVVARARGMLPATGGDVVDGDYVAGDGVPVGHSPVLIPVLFDCPAFPDRDQRIDQLASRIGEAVRETTGVDVVSFPIGPVYLRYPAAHECSVGPGDSITTGGPSVPCAGPLAALLVASDRVRQASSEEGTEDALDALYGAADTLRGCLRDAHGGDLPERFHGSRLT